ncbi:pilus (MSHA type) biogenesis protein MshL [Dissulfurispira thermophila]|uniref:Pilus (MSHA type) biogenesis protein MshL n=1 Tax=Dissulfurispira thermophila TaxID=2715679 RepID=A0A7G1H4P1_9BACT|nr:pilus (MSHA type) biogenesis protein MshL [Dissulfurispira thermophila]
MDKDRLERQVKKRQVEVKKDFFPNLSLKLNLSFLNLNLNLSLNLSFLTLTLTYFLTLTCFSCSYTDIKREIRIPEEVREIKPDRPVPSEPKIPEYTPVTEDISPVKTRIVDIVARNTPLRDVLHVIAEATGLNLVMEKGVAAETPVTLTLKNVSAEDALNTIFTSVDYFYTVKDNMLIVKAVDTRIFELGHPAIVQTYSVDVGGDILGGATGSLTAGGTTTGGTTTIKGNITQSSKSDTTAFNFWDAIEKSIASILGTTATAASSQAAPSGQSFTINRLTGTIFVTATKRNLERVEQYINTIKKVISRQVLVEAKIIEVQLSEGLKYGIDWSFVNRTMGSGEINITASGFSSVVNSENPNINIPNINMGITRGASFSTLLQALKQQGEVRTLSNPRVNIMNGQTALLSVGKNISFISKVETTTTTATGATPTTTFSVQTSNILSGIIIGIVPYINDSGEISLTITPIISDLIQLQDKTIGSGGNQTQISLPTVDLRELTTTVKVRDGQMIIIGGLISKKENLQDNKVPVLGDIPIIGEAFKNRDKSESRSELVVVLQPVLVSR